MLGYDWAYIVPVVAIAGGITLAILNSYWKHKAQSQAAMPSPDLASALTESAAVNKALLARLDSIESRLASVEKTLTDIP
ncbi:MAG: hypothetical protein ACYCZY_13465 [Lacisediminihabitans sp.]